MSSYLIDHVSVLPHYQRSIRFDVDVGREDVLKSYVMTTSGAATLAELAQFLYAGNQAAFTWTGPYGTGKSALAVYLAALADRDSKIRKLAQQMLPNNSTGDFVRSMFGTQGKRWKVVPITGDRRNIYELINEGLKKAGFTKKGAIPKTAEGLIQRVEEASLSEAFKGARPLIILDEMGKCLESALLGDGDIYDFQQVAEGFARSSAKPVLIGILHQSFEYYASRMSNEIRQEWSKIQGRFADLTLKTTTDEVVGLAAQAIQADYDSPKSETVATAVFQTIKALRPNLDSRIALDLRGCWPLHPISVMLVSALSRKAFTQAQRSLFGFLSSNDPAGFRDFLKHTAFSREVSFNPSHVFDYIATNFDQVLASSAAEGKRWVMIKEGLSRVESRFGQTHCDVFKTIAVMELLREPQSMVPSDSALAVLFGEFVDVQEVTRDLSSLSVIVYRRYQDCWALFAGSDFDLEAALRDELQGLALSQRDFENALDLAPVVAKSYYSESGALRWLDRGLIDVGLARTGKFSSQSDGALATLVLVIGASERDLLAFSTEARLQRHSEGSAMGAILGIPESEPTCRHAVSAYQILAECVALENILRNRLELDSDEVARRLIRERLEAARSGLANHLIALTGQVVWRASWNEKLCSRIGEKLSSFASRVARDRFPNCPPINNDLLNREGVSTAAAKARKELMIRMLDAENLDRLGMTGWPAEAGLYASVIQRTSHHVQRAGIWLFECSPEREDEFGTLWRQTDDFLRSSEAISATRLYAFWRATPFGLKAGLAPLLLWLYLLARKHEVVFYIDGTFQPALVPINADELLRKPNEFSLRLLTIAEDEKALLECLAEKFAKSNGQLIPTDVLNVARAVVREFLILPTWTKRTSLASVDARKIRIEVLKASDPNQLLFVVLPNLFGTSDPDLIADSLVNALIELRGLLPEMVAGLWKDFVSSLGIESWADSDIESLRSRAEEISDSISHPGLKTLLPRLRSMDSAGQSILEQQFSLICTSAGKTDRDFYDHDIDIARQTLREWALEFRRTELLKQLTHDSKHRAALTIGLGIPDAACKVITVDVDRRLVFSGGDAQLSARFGALSREDQAIALIELSRAFLEEMPNER